MITEHGKHFYFKVPEAYPFDSNKSGKGWYCALGIRAEFKLGGGQSKEHIPFKVGGVNRKWAVGGLLNEDIDDLPAELWPLQKSKTRPFDFTTLGQARNQGFSEYAFALAWKGYYSIEQIQSAIQGVNDFVLDDSLRVREINTVLREETLDKLRNILNKQEEKNLSTVDVANELIEKFTLIYINKSLYSYQGGVYRPFDEEKANAYMAKHYPFTKIRFRQEVIAQIKGAAFVEQVEDCTLINLKNGFLDISSDGTTSLLPHSPDQVSFKQFRAIYNPEARCPELEKALSDAFNGSSEDVALFDQVIGYLLMNHTKYAKATFFVGRPNSGKSTFITMITNFCGGNDHVSTIGLGDLNKRFGLAGIVNKTANILADLKDEKMLASDTFKRLVTGDAVKIEQKYKSDFSYVWTGKFLFGMNQLPDFSKDFNGVERRVIILNFQRVYKKTDPDFNPDIDEILKTDEAMSVLLNHALSGYRSLTEGKGFIETKQSKKQMASFISANDSVVAWVESLDDFSLLEREPISGPDGIYSRYVHYCNSSGEEPKRQRDFTNTIKTRYAYDTIRKRIGPKGEKVPMFVKR